LVEERNLYKGAWQILATCFGEQMQDRELDLMDSVLASVKFDSKELKDAISNKAPEQV